MLEVKGIRCWLKDQINNNRLPEYQVEKLNEHTVRAYISSEDGLEFSIKALLPRDEPAVVPHVYVNDQKINGLVVQPATSPLSVQVMGIFRSCFSYMPFYFGVNEFNGGKNTWQKGLISRCHGGRTATES